MEVFMTIGPALLGLGFGLLLVHEILKAAKEKKARIEKAVDNSPISVFRPVDESTLCSSLQLPQPHEWEDISMLDATTKEQTTRPVCMKCGFVSGPEGNQFTQKSLEKIKFQKKTMKEMEEFYNELRAFTASQIEIMAHTFELKNEDLSLSEAFLAGYAANKIIETQVQEKINEKRKQQLEKVLEIFKAKQ